MRRHVFAFFVITAWLLRIESACNAQNTASDQREGFALSKAMINEILFGGPQAPLAKRVPIDAVSLAYMKQQAEFEKTALGLAIRDLSLARAQVAWQRENLALSEAGGKPPCSDDLSKSILDASLKKIKAAKAQIQACLARGDSTGPYTCEQIAAQIKERSGP